MQRILALALLVMLAFSGRGWADAPLRVLVTGEAPFVTTLPDGSFDGISVRLWKAVAQKAGIEFQWAGMVPMHSGLEAVAQGTADVVVGPVGITSARARLISFSQPYYFASQGIASLQRDDPRTNFIRDYLLVGLSLGSAVVSVLVAVGFVVWLLERRRHHEHFPQSFWPGLASGMWLAVVTITTVGYGDRVPETRLGRIFTAAMMICGMLFASTLTATLTSVMAQYSKSDQQLDRPAQLAGKHLASVASSSSAQYAARWGQDLTLAPTIERAMQLLLVGQVDAVVYHYPETLHWCHAHPDEKIHLASVDSAVSQYGFVLPLNSPRVHAVSQAILELTEQGTVQRIQEQWLADILPPAPQATPDL